MARPVTFLQSDWSWALIGAIALIGLGSCRSMNALLDVVMREEPVLRNERNRMVDRSMRWIGAFQATIGAFLALSGQWSNAITLMLLGPMMAISGPFWTGSILDRRFPQPQYDKPIGPEPRFVATFLGYDRPAGPPTLDEWLDE